MIEGRGAHQGLRPGTAWSPASPPFPLPKPEPRPGVSPGTFDLESPYEHSAWPSRHNVPRSEGLVIGQIGSAREVAGGAS